jgi:predicted nucleotidyltransferase
MMENRLHLRRRLQAELEPHQEVLFVYLYGSFLDDDLPYHDVDVAIYLNPGWALGRDLFEYEMTIAVELTRALHVPVDVHVLNEAPFGFQHSVLHRGEVLSSRDDEFLTDFIEQVALPYMEFSYHARKYLQEVTS